MEILDPGVELWTAEGVVTLDPGVAIDIWIVDDVVETLDPGVELWTVEDVRTLDPGVAVEQ